MIVIIKSCADHSDCLRCLQVIYAYWNAEKGMYEQETGALKDDNPELKLVPVADGLRQGWREAFRKERFGEIEWEWKKAGSIPGGEDKKDPRVAERYAQVSAAIRMGESIFPRGATEESMQGYHSGWKETHGVFQVRCVCVERLV